MKGYWAGSQDHTCPQGDAIPFPTFPWPCCTFLLELFGYTLCYGLNCVHLKFICWILSLWYLKMWLDLEKGILKRSLVWVLLWHDRCPYKKRRSGHRHTRRGDHVRTQGGDGRLQPGEKPWRNKPWSWPSSLQNWEEINRCLSLPACGTCYSSPSKWIHGVCISVSPVDYNLLRTGIVSFHLAFPTLSMCLAQLKGIIIMMIIK